jgi:hypothetical protein
MFTSLWRAVLAAPILLALAALRGAAALIGRASPAEAEGAAR